MVKELWLREIGGLKTAPVNGDVTLGIIRLEKVRSLCVQINMTYNASATLGGSLKVYFSPTGEQGTYDTIPYGTEVINFTANTTVRETIRIDPLPNENGYLKLIVTNADTTYTITNVVALAVLGYFEDAFKEASSDALKSEEAYKLGVS